MLSIFTWIGGGRAQGWNSGHLAPVCSSPPGYATGCWKLSVRGWGYSSEWSRQDLCLHQETNGTKCKQVCHDCIAVSSKETVNTIVKCCNGWFQTRVCESFSNSLWHFLNQQKFNWKMCWQKNNHHNWRIEYDN